MYIVVVCFHNIHSFYSLWWMDTPVTRQTDSQTWKQTVTKKNLNITLEMHYWMHWTEVSYALIRVINAWTSVIDSHTAALTAALKEVIERINLHQNLRRVRCDQHIDHRGQRDNMRPLTLKISNMHYMQSSYH